MYKTSVVIWFYLYIYLLNKWWSIYLKFFRSCLIGGVNWRIDIIFIIGCYIGEVSVESRSRVSQYIGWVAFYYRSTGRPTVSHESIGSALPSIGISCVPVNNWQRLYNSFFFQLRPQGFSFCWGTCQLTHMDTFLLITHIGCGWYQIVQILNRSLFSCIGRHLHHLSVDIHAPAAILGESQSIVGWLTRQVIVNWGFGHYVK